MPLNHAPGIGFYAIPGAYIRYVRPPDVQERTDLRTGPHDDRGNF